MTVMFELPRYPVQGQAFLLVYIIILQIHSFIQLNHRHAHYAVIGVMLSHYFNQYEQIINE